jgi:hypothetical protein
MLSGLKFKTFHPEQNIEPIFPVPNKGVYW